MPGEHLLVIDDSPTLLKVVETTLTRAGYRVDTAADGGTLCRWCEIGIPFPTSSCSTV